MHSRNDDLIQLQREILDRSPSAALPSNLPGRWLDAALHDLETIMNAVAETDAGCLRLPLNLVLHVLDLPTRAEPSGMSDEQLFQYLRRYRFELAMEKLRRWGVQLAPPATESTIFAPKKFIVP